MRLACANVCPKMLLAHLADLTFDTKLFSVPPWRTFYKCKLISQYSAVLFKGTAVFSSFPKGMDSGKLGEASPVPFRASQLPQKGLFLLPLPEL